MRACGCTALDQRQARIKLTQLSYRNLDVFGIGLDARHRNSTALRPVSTRSEASTSVETDVGRVTERDPSQPFVGAGAVDCAPDGSPLGGGLSDIGLPHAAHGEERLTVAVLRMARHKCAHGRR